MKKLYFGLLSILFGTAFWLSYANGDIIYNNVNIQEENNYKKNDDIWSNSIDSEENLKIDLIPNSIWKLIQNTKIILFFVAVSMLILYIIFSSLDLWYIFEKLQGKRKQLILSFASIKKRIFEILILLVFCI